MAEHEDHEEHVLCRRRGQRNVPGLAVRVKPRHLARRDRVRVRGSSRRLPLPTLGYSVGLQSGAATNFASVTTAGPSVSYTTANNAQLDAIRRGTAYLFTPNAPAAPTNLTFTNVTAISMTLNWIDNASNEVGYAIYQSTDGTNYSFVAQTAADATSLAISGLTPSTTYHFRVFAVPRVQSARR